MARKRRVFSAAFKAKVALEAIKGHRTISELAARHKLHATQINLGKKQLLEGAEEVFQNGTPSKQSNRDEARGGRAVRTDRSAESAAGVA